MNTKLERKTTLSKSAADRIEAEINVLKSKILNSFENGDNFSPHRATSLLLFFVEQIVSNPQCAQLEARDLTTLYQLRYLLDDFETLSELNRTLRL